MVDEDIIAQLGFTKLDDFIGDPGSVNDKSYPDLIQTARNYWKKYTTKNDINSYINMFTLFDLSFFKQLEQLLPARVDKLTGILIQPNILERSKDKILPKIVRTNDSYTTVITDTKPTASADYNQYIGGIDGSILSLSANDDDQFQAYLTSSISKRYDGTTYVYTNLITSGSDYFGISTQGNITLTTQDDLELQTQDILNQPQYIKSFTPFWRSEGVLPTIISSRLSEFKQVTNVPAGIYGGYSYGTGIYGTGSKKYAHVSDYLPTGIDNQKYNGSKLTGADFNIASVQTVDGGAVVEYRTANPNQLIYQQQTNDNGSFVLV